MLSITPNQILSIKMQKGDIVGRKANFTNVQVDSNVRELMIHMGIYMGNNILLDLFQTGLREITITDFVAENNGSNTFEVLRFKGDYKDIIISHLNENLKNHNYYLPSSSYPWNLMSNAENYESANCADFLHAQFLYAIRQLKENSSFDNEQDKEKFNKIYANNRLIDSQKVTFPKYAIRVSNQFQATNGSEDNAFHNRFENPEVHDKVVTFPFHSFHCYKQSNFFESVSVENISTN